MTLRAELAALVDEILRHTKPGDEVALDTIGDALGARAVSSEEIDAMLSAIEKRKRKVITRSGGGGEATLKIVLATARILRTELARVPKSAEIAERAGLAPLDVAHALALVRVMQR